MMAYSPLELRFWSKVDRKSDFECWPWLKGRGSAGYGNFWIDGRQYGTHCVAWELTHGLIKQEIAGPRILVCHRCDNPPCCNPSHLFLGTDSDNAVDRVKKNRGNLPFGERHWSAKLTENTVRAIYHDPLDTFAAGKKFGVNQSVVSRIRSRRAWKHINMEAP